MNIASDVYVIMTYTSDAMMIISRRVSIYDVHTLIWESGEELAKLRYCIHPLLQHRYHYDVQTLDSKVYRTTSKLQNGE